MEKESLFNRTIRLTLLSHPGLLVPLGEVATFSIEGLPTGYAYGVYQKFQHTLYPNPIINQSTEPQFTIFPEAVGDYTILINYKNDQGQTGWLQKQFRVGKPEKNLETDYQPSLAASQYGHRFWTSNPWEALFYKHHELGPTQKFLDMIQEGDVVYDIGANLGNHAIQIARKTGETGWVYCFEANPLMVYLLNANLFRNDLSNTMIVPLAITDKTREVEFKVNLGNSLIGVGQDSSFFHQKAGMKLLVSGMGLDEIISSYRLKAPDVIKMDIEGAEGAALIGMKNTLRQHKPLLLLEVHDLKAAETCFEILDLYGYQYEDAETGENFQHKTELLENYSQKVGLYFCYPIQRRNN